MGRRSRDLGHAGGQYGFDAAGDVEKDPGKVNPSSTGRDPPTPDVEEME